MSGILEMPCLLYTSNCVKPDLNDVGIIGQRIPNVNADVCKGCKKCAIEAACPNKVAKMCIRDRSHRVQEKSGFKHYAFDTYETAFGTTAVSYTHLSADLLRKSLLSHPSSKALLCKHEQLFDLLTLVS